MIHLRGRRWMPSKGGGGLIVYDEPVNMSWNEGCVFRRFYCYFQVV